MIGVEELAESARYMDALSEEHGFDDFCELIGVEIDGFQYVANQRALRAAMLIDGQDPTKLSRTEKTAIKLSPEVQALMLPLTALAIDCFAIGLDAGRRREREIG